MQGWVDLSYTKADRPGLNMRPVNLKSSALPLSHRATLVTTTYEEKLLLRQRERWRSIVMSTSVCVCVSVCLSACLRVYFSNHTRDLYQLIVHVAYGRGSVLLRRGDEILREGAILGGFFLLYSRAFGTHTKTAEPIEMPFSDGP